ncbi:hypothetical protein KDA00_00720 [Candidatus Saccharibacteria bacterium]|nr:hypothetical protein [Candidatus Saccharibacteria bacterium]
MDNARIAHFEDNESLRQLLSEMFQYYGHAIVGVASTMEEAGQLVEHIEPGEVDIAIVDGNLTRNGPGQVGENRDGAEIANLLRSKFGNSVTIIGYPGYGVIEGADVNLQKGKPQLLIDKIAEI